MAGAGAAADRESVPWAKLLAVVDLHTGVLAHSSVRALDRAGWRIDEGGPAADGGLQLSLSPGSVAAKLEQLQAALGQALEEAPLTKDSVKQWVAEGRVDFVEIFDGSRRLSLAVSREGERVGPGFDKIRVSYGQCWDLAAATVRERLWWLLFEVMHPCALHAASPCRRWCTIGLKEPGPEEFILRDLVVELLRHQQGLGLLASHEQPLGSLLLADPSWVAAFGAVEAPKPPWQYVTLDACQWGSCSPSCGVDQQPVKKGLTLMANFDLRPLGLRCGARRKLPDAPETPEEVAAVDAVEARPGPQLWPAALEAQPVFALRGGGFVEAQDAEAQEQPFVPEPREKRKQWRMDLEAEVLAAHSRWRKRARPRNVGARWCSRWRSTVVWMPILAPATATVQVWSVTSSLTRPASTHN